MMAVDIRLPNINSTTDAGQIAQIRSYLYQFAEQMQWALNTIESGNTTSVDITATKKTGGTAESDDFESNFNSVKSLIMKSADVIDSYCDQIKARLEGVYVAQSDFGTYTEKTDLDIEANSTSIKQNYENIQQILSDIETLSDKIIYHAYIRTGLLYYDDDGSPVYGLEIGQKNTVDGEEVFDKYARFTSDRMSFYDQNDIEVAYISDYKLFITNAEITGTLTLGGYRIDTSNGLSFKWVGRD